MEKTFGSPGTSNESGNPGTSAENVNPGTSAENVNPGTSKESGNPGTSKESGNPGTSKESGNPGTSQEIGVESDFTPNADDYSSSSSEYDPDIEDACERNQNMTYTVTYSKRSPRRNDVVSPREAPPENVDEVPLYELYRPLVDMNIPPPICPNHPRRRYNPFLRAPLEYVPFRREPLRIIRGADAETDDSSPTYRSSSNRREVVIRYSAIPSISSHQIQGASANQTLTIRATPAIPDSPESPPPAEPVHSIWRDPKEPSDFYYKPSTSSVKEEPLDAYYKPSTSYMNEDSSDEDSGEEQPGCSSASQKKIVRCIPSLVTCELCLVDIYERPSALCLECGHLFCEECIARLERIYCVCPKCFCPFDPYEIVKTFLY